jgi:hypothetical protein
LIKSNTYKDGNELSATSLLGHRTINWSKLTLLCCAFLLLCLYQNVAYATTPTSYDKVFLQNKVKGFLEPEAGLNNEIRAGLVRLEQICTFTNKGNPATTGSLTNKSALVPKELDSVRAVVSEQKAIADKAIAEYRALNNLNNNSCAALPEKLRISEQCARYQAASERVQIVSQATKVYFDETLARFNSYGAAVDLEAKGCTRPDFAHKLWMAEQIHIVPKLKTSGQLLSDLLK